MLNVNRKLFVKLAEPANLVTLSGFLVMFCAFLFRMNDIRFAPWIEFLVFLYGYQIADHIDGHVARFTRKQSLFGEFLDLYVDRTADLLMCVIVLVKAPEHYPAIVVFFMFKMASEHVLGRTVGGVDHKNPGNTKFSKVYTLFHRQWILESYLIVKALFFVPTVIGFPIPMFDIVFCAVIVFRGIYILELFSSLIPRPKEVMPCSEGLNPGR